MPLRLIAGPANAGKVERLLDRYLATLNREPVLIVPNRSDVATVELERLASASPGAHPVLSPTQRALLVRRVVSNAALNGLSASARFGGFADELLRTIGELESGMLDPEEVGGELAPLYAA